jgi:ZIP family zinc transporter
VSFSSTVILGFIAGATIALGLLVGRLKMAAPRFRALLNATAIGVLLFLVVDVVSHALAPVEAAIHQHHNGTVAVRSISLVVGVAAGVLGLVSYDGWSRRRRARRGAAESGDLNTPAQMSLLLAIGIGLHNFGEGLAIGSSSHSGALGLSTVLVIGFALHNATEGFGIVAPLAAGPDRPTWGFLGLMALIGGGPTTIGTLVGWTWSSATLNVIFFSLAAGSILYVVVQLFNVAQRQKAGNLLYYGILTGLTTGLLTDVLVTWAGA